MKTLAEVLIFVALLSGGVWVLWRLGKHVIDCSADEAVASVAKGFWIAGVTIGFFHARLSSPRLLGASRT